MRPQPDFEAAVVPTLEAYTAVPCLSPLFDPDWEAHGHLRGAAELLAGWARTRAVPGLTVEVRAPAGRSPVVVCRADGGAGDGGGVLIYGHLDKQPVGDDWRPGLHPFRAVREGDRLYGRGTADDGYALFAALCALEDLVAAGTPFGPVTVLIEASEESGSPDLAAHLEDLAPDLGTPRLVLCLDSGCLSYDRLWTTLSLRGALAATVRVEVLTEGVHSGLWGGVVPSSVRILRRLLSRVEDEDSGQVLLPELVARVPELHRMAAATAATAAPVPVGQELPTVEGLVLGGADSAERLLRRAWAPSLTVTGLAGLPPPESAGNVIVPSTTAQLSVRIPPTVDAERAARALEAVLLADPPEGARVTVALEAAADGWMAPDPEPWVAEALTEASEAAFGRPPAAYGEGGTIPFLATLARRFPDAQLVATGVLGPESNAHGPNEFLHLPTARAVSGAVATLVAAAARA